MLPRMTNPATPPAPAPSAPSTPAPAAAPPIMTASAAGPSAPQAVGPRAVFQRQVVEVANTLAGLVEPVDPPITVMALISVIVTHAMRAGMPREKLVEAIGEAFDRTRVTMDALGIKPGEPPPADLQARIEKMMQPNGGG